MYGCSRASQVALMVKNPPANAEDLRDLRSGFDSWVGKTPGGGMTTQLQYSYLENPMDRGAWLATVHGIPNSWTRLSTCTQGCFILLCGRNKHNIVKQLHTDKKF